MTATKPYDDLSSYYADLLEGGYDCVDRIVVNAYFPLGQTGGGLRSWWRVWKGGEKTLSDAGMKTVAGDFARHLRAWCQKRGVPFIECQSGEEKHVLAESLLPKDPKFRGVFAVLTGRAPAPVWQVQFNQRGQIVNLCHRDPWPHVQHYYFQIVDPEWGHVMVRMCGYPPFGAQVALNGHEWVQRQGRRRHAAFCQEGNCFIEGSDFAKVDQIAAQLLGAGLEASLQKVCERWLYSACLCFVLPVEEQRRSGFGYKFSIWQIEYSRNLLFRDGPVMEEVYQKLIDRTRVSLDIKALKTVFGVRHRQPRRKQRAGRSEPEVSKEVERVGPCDVTVFKVRWGNLVLKIYDKGQRVLRVEVKALNTKALKTGKLLEKLPEILGRMQQMLVRFLAVVQAAHISFLDAGQWERWAEPTQRGNRRLAGLDMNKARNRAVVETVVALASVPEGFAVEQVAQEMRQRLGCAPEAYSTRRAAYDLAKVRGKGLVERMPGRRRYQSQPTQLRALCGYVLLREQVIKPLLAGAGKTSLQPPPRQLSPIDQQYIVLREHMTQTFELLGLAA
jgi:hypothetical protein